MQTPHIKTETQGQQLILRIQGRFDFHQHSAFREALASVEPQQALVIDLTGVDYMDSSALGLLLLARQEFKGQAPRAQEIELRFLKASLIDEVLETAHFERLFKMKGL